MKQSWLILFLLISTACSLAPEAAIPTDRIPQDWLNAPSNATPANLTVPAHWTDLGSTELNRLIAQALANNTDIAAALARIEQARASAKIAGSGLYPQIDASGSVGRDINRTRGNSLIRDSDSATLNLSYELDLWQKNHDQHEAALWQLNASEFDRTALTLLTSSEVARLYTGLLAFDARMDVATKNLKNAQEILRITELRHRVGTISGLELAQQRTTVQNTQAAIESLKNQRDLYFNQLAQTVGTAPSALVLAPETLDRLKDAPLALAHPWELVQRRPDIAAAEARLRAAGIAIGVARAQALPSISLAFNGGVAGNPASTLVGMAASFFAPIFQGNALEGEIERSEAVRDEQVANYQSVLLTAFREIEDALSTYNTAVSRRHALSIAAEEARKANTIADAQFKEGSIDFTTLIATQNALLQAEDSYQSAVQAQFAARIDLMRALGGAI